MAQQDEALPPPPPPPPEPPTTSVPTQAYWGGSPPPQPSDAIPPYFEPSTLIPGMQPPPPLPHRPRHRRRVPRWFITGLIALGALLIGVIIGSTGERSSLQSDPTPTVTRVVTHQAKVQPVPTVTKTVIHTHRVYVTPTANAAGQATQITSDGVYVVGTDIASGTWHTSGDGGQTGGQCYEATLSGSNSVSDIISNNNFDGPDTVNLAGAYGFQISGPCTWSLES